MDKERDSLTNGRSAIQLEDYGATSSGEKQRDDDRVYILNDQDQASVAFYTQYRISKWTISGATGHHCIVTLAGTMPG